MSSKNISYLLPYYQMMGGNDYFCADEAAIIDDVCEGIAVVAFYAAQKGNASTFLTLMPLRCRQDLG
jgi:hypothetical protein